MCDNWGSPLGSAGSDGGGGRSGTRGGCLSDALYLQVAEGYRRALPQRLPMPLQELIQVLLSSHVFILQFVLSSTRSASGQGVVHVGHSPHDVIKNSLSPES